MKKLLTKEFLLVIICMGAFVLLGLRNDSNAPALDKNIYKGIKTFNEVFDMVQKNYVDEVSSTTLIQGAINGMVKSLDPHSSFMTPDLYKELEVETQGAFGGIGIEITILKDILTIVSPIEDTPAFVAGIKPGDQILRIDGKSTKYITVMEAVKKLRGPKDTKVTITIMREKMSTPKDIVLTRAIIQIKSVKVKYFDDIGYIRIAAFQERTSDDLNKALKEISKKLNPMKGLVLDLRNDPGGLLNQAIEVSDMFLKSGIIVSTRGRAKNMETKATAKDDGNEITCPIVVLVNEGTASAAEIVAGALQDNGRALIIGTQTFGKASVQTVIPLEDGSALKLTTARYYTPKGRSIQAEGIKPDIIVKYIRPTAEDAENTAWWEDRVKEKDLKGHIKPAKEDGTKIDEPQTPEVKDPSDLVNDKQLKTAIDILKGWDIMKKNLNS
jgi:carboxyl-terminal processing protease